MYRYGPAIVFLLNTGLRGGELLALGQSSIVPFLGRRGIKITHTLSRVKNRETGSKKKAKMILTPPKYPNSLRTIPLNKEAEFSLSCMMAQAVTTKILPPYFFRQNYRILKKKSLENLDFLGFSRGATRI